MRCVKYERLIYLFSELDPQDKTTLQSHMESCSSCQVLFRQVRDERDLFKQVYTPGAAADVDLAEKIMRAIPEKSTTPLNVVDKIFDIIAGRGVRYAMAAASAVLIVFFISELSWRPESAHLVYEHDASPGDVKFDSDVFYEPVKETLTFSRQEISSSRLSLYECLRHCQDNSGELCIDCKEKYLKNKI
jgi:hypothetical protein